MWVGAAVLIVGGCRTRLFEEDVDPISIGTPDLATPDLATPDFAAPDLSPPGCVGPRACGSDVGACHPGTRSCSGGVLGPCLGALGPAPEQCNGIDDDCDGDIDNGFRLGEACDGPDKDLCVDDIITCAGCSTGSDNPESCNGVDDDCNGIVDSDCTVGDCEPKLLVASLDKSSPNCFVDSVQTGSTGRIQYGCAGGGLVSAMFGPILFTGAVTLGQASLTASTQFPWGDGCTWESSQTIVGTISSGHLAYSYSEMPIAGTNCLPPCTASGEIKVLWQ